MTGSQRAAVQRQGHRTPSRPRGIVDHPAPSIGAVIRTPTQPRGGEQPTRHGVQVRAGLLVATLLLGALAGCMQPSGGQDNGTEVPPGDGGNGPLPGFDGEAAWQWVHDIVYDGDELRPRHPAHPGHNGTAQWLADAMEVPGWQVTTSSFSGQDYIELEKPEAVQTYTGPSSHWCGEHDWDKLPDLWFTNVVATLPGTGDGHAMLGAHWDAKEDTDEGHPPVPGANDGASGVGLLLQMQRHIHQHNISFPFDVSFAFFDGEDGFEDCHPLAGSIHYAAQGVAIDRFILLDMVGDADARFPREGRSVQSDPDLVDLIWSKAPDHGLGDNFVDDQKSVLDDHVPFIEAGVPSVDIIDFARSDGRFGFPPYWHTDEDTPDKLDPGMLGRMGDLLLDVLHDPAFRQWP